MEGCKDVVGLTSFFISFVTGIKHTVHKHCECQQSFSLSQSSLSKKQTKTQGREGQFEKKKNSYSNPTAFIRVRAAE